MGDATENKAAIDRLDQEFRQLQTENINLKATVAKRKLPAKSPSIFKYGDSNFDEFTKSLRNYLITMGVLEKHHVQVLLTYICNKSYSLVTRVFPAEDLITEDYWKACQNIEKIVTQNINPTDATVKLLNVKQSNMNTQEFISKIENYAKIAFPSKEDDNARDKCMTASLLANLKNQNIRLELQKFQKADAEKPPSFAANTLKLMELEQMMGCPVDDDDDTSLTILNVGAEKSRLCHIYNSTQHLKYLCPQNPRNKSSDQSYIKNSASNQGQNEQANNFRQNFNAPNYQNQRNFTQNVPFNQQRQFYHNTYRNNYPNNYRNNYPNNYRNNYPNNYKTNNVGNNYPNRKSYGNNYNYPSNCHNGFNNYNNFNNNSRVYQQQNSRNLENFNNSYNKQNTGYNYQQKLLPKYSQPQAQFENKTNVFNTDLSENVQGPNTTVNVVEIEFEETKN